MSEMSLQNMQLCSRESGTFFRFSNPKSRPLTWMHRAITNAVDAIGLDGSPLYKRIVICGPRGLGKTSLVLKGTGCQRTAFQRMSFAVYMTADFNLASRKTHGLRQFFKGSQWVHENFGQPVTRDDVSGIRLHDSDKAFTIRFPSDNPEYQGTAWIPRGLTQSVRGIGDDDRIQFLLVDDIDNPRKFRSELSMAQIQEIFFADTLPAIDEHYENTQVIYCGTMSHDDCIAAKLKDMPGWKSVWLSMCDDNFKTVCPEWYSQEFVDQKIAEFKSIGRMDIFYREYMGKPGYGIDQPFKEEMFRQYDGKVEGAAYVIIDPAKKRDGASETAIGLEIVNGRGIFVEEADSEHWGYNEWQYKVLQKIQRNGRVAKVYIEDDGGNEQLTEPLRNFLSSHGCGIDVEPLRSRTGKEDNAGVSGSKDARILSLVLPYTEGRIHHKRGMCAKLEQRLLDYRPGMAAVKGKPIDIIDMHGYIHQVMKKEGLSFAPGVAKGEKRKTVDELLAERRDGAMIDRMLAERRQSMAGVN